LTAFSDGSRAPIIPPTWEKHDVGNSPPFHGNVEAALSFIKAKVLYMPSQTDLYFPVGDARYKLLEGKAVK
jgi:homoserine acetyltransferase